MTDEQIEKGCELCINVDGINDCDACPYNEELLCITELQTDCLAYINRLKAEEATLIKEADDNAALAMEQKLRADRLETQLQANLEKAYEHNEDECKRCMEKVEQKQSLLLEETEKRVRQETAKEIGEWVSGMVIPTFIPPCARAYERLTKRNEFGEVWVSAKDDRELDKKFMSIANRLAELEDKLESGELVDTTQKTIRPFNRREQRQGYVIWAVKAEEYPIEIVLDTKEAAEARLKELQEGKK